MSFTCLFRATVQIWCFFLLAIAVGLTHLQKYISAFYKSNLNQNKPYKAFRRHPAIFTTLYIVERVWLWDQEPWKTNGRRQSKQFKISRAAEKGNLSSFVITNAWSMMQAGCFQDTSSMFYNSVKLIGTGVLSGICSKDTYFTLFIQPEFSRRSGWVPETLQGATSDNLYLDDGSPVVRAARTFLPKLFPILKGARENNPG